MGAIWRSVDVRVYDLSQGRAALFSPLFMKRPIQGVWHSGILVFGTEYFYGGYIDRLPPAEVELEIGYPPALIQNLGSTSKTRAELEKFLAEIDHDFTPSTYDLVAWNCNHFADVCARFLLDGRGIPRAILQQSQKISQTLLGRAVVTVLQLAHDNANPVAIASTTKSAAPPYATPRLTDRSHTQRPEPTVEPRHNVEPGLVSEAKPRLEAEVEPSSLQASGQKTARSHLPGSWGQSFRPHDLLERQAEKARRKNFVSTLAEIKDWAHERTEHLAQLMTFTCFTPPSSGADYDDHDQISYSGSDKNAPSHTDTHTHTDTYTHTDTHTHTNTHTHKGAQARTQSPTDVPPYKATNSYAGRLTDYIDYTQAAFRQSSVDSSAPTVIAAPSVERSMTRRPVTSPLLLAFLAESPSPSSLSSLGERRISDLSVTSSQSTGAPSTIATIPRHTPTRNASVRIYSKDEGQSERVAGAVSKHVPVRASEYHSSGRESFNRESVRLATHCRTASAQPLLHRTATDAPAPFLLPSSTANHLPAAVPARLPP